MNKHNAEAVATQIEEQWGNVFVASAVRSIGEENAKLREQLAGCTRSHPHENMTKTCELRTEIARLTNHLAAAEAKLADARTRLSGQTCFVPPEFQAELDECKAKLKAASEQEPFSFERHEELDGYVIDYEFRGDDGDYQPTETERMLITDAIAGYIDQMPKLYADPVPPVDVQELQTKYRAVCDRYDEQEKRIAELERKLAEAQTSIEWWMKAAECTKDKLTKAREEGRKEAVPEGWQVVQSIPELGSASVNEASWAVTEHLPTPIPGNVWNNIKPAFYAGLVKWLAAAPTPGESLKPSFSVEWTIDHLAHPQIESGEKE